MPMNQDSAARTLDAIADLVDLLRLSHSAAHRAEAELTGGLFDQTDEISRQLHTLRQSARALQLDLDRFVSSGSSPANPDDEARAENDFGAFEYPGNRRVRRRRRTEQRL